MTSDAVLDLVLAHLADASVSPRAAQLVEAAFAGDAALRNALNGVVADPSAHVIAAGDSDPREVYVARIAVEGFRGIGASVELELEPTPGLTLVVGRNGSGKSSFAEGLEAAFTGEVRRLRDRTLVWKEGFSNIHTAVAPRVTVGLIAGGRPLVIERRWKRDGIEVSDQTVDGGPVGGSAPWERALRLYRPFLAYAELASSLEESTTKLHDALSTVLGLERIADAEARLRAARLEREKPSKDLKPATLTLLACLEGGDDARAALLVPLVKARTVDVHAIEAVLDSGTADVAVDLATARVAALTLPALDLGRTVIEEVGLARAARSTVTESDAGRVVELGKLLRRALDYSDQFAPDSCPVCSVGLLDTAWQVRTRAQLDEMEQALRKAHDDEQRLRAAEAALGSFIDEVRALAALLGRDAGESALAIEIGETCDAIMRDPLVPGLINGRLAPLLLSAAAVRDRAGAARAAQQEAWRPIADATRLWLAHVRRVQDAERPLRELKDAEMWLKSTGAAIRADRFAPIAEQAAANWALLRQGSNVSLERLALAGSGSQRKVGIEVTVDGTDTNALGVMSQGELNALGLSIFLPRASMDESPFRFIVIDDPVQSLDPSKVEGLARALHGAARTRQVVVFTHDPRLGEAVVHLGFPVRQIAVSRRTGSAVEVKTVRTPALTYLSEARTLARSADVELPRAVAPGLCRLAIEAAATEAARRYVILRGKDLADFEERFQRSHLTLTEVVGLALTGEFNRGAEALPTIHREAGRIEADTLRDVNAGAHGAYHGDLSALVDGSTRLVRYLDAIARP